MKIIKWVEQSIEVEITREECVTSLMDLADKEVKSAIDGINTAYLFLSRIPDSIIAEMTPGQREIIRIALQRQTLRYEEKPKGEDRS